MKIFVTAIMLCVISITADAQTTQQKNNHASDSVLMAKVVVLEANVQQQQLIIETLRAQLKQYQATAVQTNDSKHLYIDRRGSKQGVYRKP